MTAELLLKTGGVFHLLLALIHFGFWRFLRWRDELAKLMRINSAIVQVLNIQLTYVFVVVACLSFFYARDLLTTPLGRVLTASISLFWVLRTIEQIIYFRVSHWLVSAFGLLFVCGALLYALALFIG